MSPRDSSESTCLGPGCSNLVKQTRVGRRRVYCCDQCGTRYRRSSRPTADNTAFAMASLDDLYRLTAQFDLSGEAPQRDLALIPEVEKAWSDIKTAVVLQSRDSRVKTRVIAQALHMSPSTLTRMMDGAPARRDRRLSSGQIPAQPRSQRHPAPGPARARRPEGGTGDMDGAAPGCGPAATLASALSHLHRRSNATYRTLGTEVGVDPSYISRAVSGERIPSWPVTRKLALALEADPEEILPLWRAARGYTLADTTDVQAALRGLRTAAAHPDIETLARRTRLTADQITHALTGPALPDWETTRAIVTALHGQHELIRPVWNAARAAAISGPAADSTTCTISAGAFG